jgi:hypothetical protein
VHGVSMPPHTFLKNRKSSRIRIYIRKGFSPLNQGPRTDVLMNKTEGRKSRDTVPLSRMLQDWTRPTIQYRYILKEKILFIERRR